MLAFIIHKDNSFQLSLVSLISEVSISPKSGSSCRHHNESGPSAHSRPNSEAKLASLQGLATPLTTSRFYIEIEVKTQLKPHKLSTWQRQVSIVMPYALKGRKVLVTGGSRYAPFTFPHTLVGTWYMIPEVVNKPCYSMLPVIDSSHIPLLFLE